MTYFLLPPQVRLKDSLVSSLQFCRAKDTELAWIDGVLDMRVVKVDTGVLPEEGVVKGEKGAGEEAVEDGELAMDVTPADDGTTDHSVVAQQRTMKTLFGEDVRELSEESDVIPTLEPLPAHEVREREMEGKRRCTVARDTADRRRGRLAVIS